MQDKHSLWFVLKVFSSLAMLKNIFVVENFLWKVIEIGNKNVQKWLFLIKDGFCYFKNMLMSIFKFRTNVLMVDFLKIRKMLDRVLFIGMAVFSSWKKYEIILINLYISPCSRIWKSVRCIDWNKWFSRIINISPKWVYTYFGKIIKKFTVTILSLECKSLR